ncbi:hypothetical protein HAX54_031213, partial [Datura stramonium]|nr:hypothetical protein [Datura stramonium]
EALADKHHSPLQTLTKIAVDPLTFATFIYPSSFMSSIKYHTQIDPKQAKQACPLSFIEALGRMASNMLC